MYTPISSARKAAILKNAVKAEFVRRVGVPRVLRRKKRRV